MALLLSRAEGMLPESYWWFRRVSGVSLRRILVSSDSTKGLGFRVPGYIVGQWKTNGSYNFSRLHGHTASQG